MATATHTMSEADMKANEDAAAFAVSRARSTLLMGTDARSAFFAALGMKLQVIPTRRVPTAATDGRSLFYSPEFIVGLTLDQTIGLVIHEIMHCVLAHQSRRDGRDPLRWNIAADLEINHRLVQHGYTLPDGGLMPGTGQFNELEPGLIAEVYYDRLPDDVVEQMRQQSGGDPDDGDGDGDGDGDPGDGSGSGPSQRSFDPGGCGGVIDATDENGNPDESAAAESAAVWKINASEAQQVAKQRGSLPGDLDRMVDEIVHETAPYEVIMRRFVEATARDDYSWLRPNRRFIGQGVYLPSMQSDELGTIAIYIDTSGSITPENLARFAKETAAIAEPYKCELVICYHHTQIYKVQVWTPDDGPLVLDTGKSGGTDHRPVFEHLSTLERVKCAVCLTDGFSAFPDDEPEVPVLWVLTADAADRLPFGEVATMGC